VEEVANPQSCTILLKGPNDHTLAQLKDAVRDGLRAVKNALVDEALVPGAGAFETALNAHLLDVTRKAVEGRAKRGVEAFAEAMLVIPKTLAENSGYDAQDVCIALGDEIAKGNKVGLDVTTGDPFDPASAGVYDNFIVKQQILHSAPVIATQLLLVDEVMRAGVNMRKR
jgi:T-complex protein 1 subunit zeta